MRKQRITYKDMHEGINCANPPAPTGGFDCIVGIAKGGLPVATVLGYKLNIPVLSVSYSAEDGNGDSLANNFYRYPFPHDGSKYKILIVDDICDTGNTLKEIRRRFESVGHDVSTYTLCAREGELMPDYYSIFIGSEVDWVDFPWEN